MTIKIKTIFYYKGKRQQVQAYRVYSYQEYLKLWEYYKKIREGKRTRTDESLWVLCKGDEKITWETAESTNIIIMSDERMFPLDKAIFQT